MYGYAGKILRIDLTNQEIKVEDLNTEWAKKYVGGRGLASKYLFEEIDPKVDPFSPENKLIVATGPLTGTSVPTGGRYMVITKSPLTGAIACSNSGGFFGAELKMAGYDMIILEGKAPKPVYIAIEDDKVEIKDASHLWGKLVYETTDFLKQEYGDKAKVLAIGPAGEKLVKIAAVMNDYDRAAGRSGVGAVMGSKNVKAIVAKGTKGVSVADEQKVKDVVASKIKIIRENPVTGEGLPAYGTAILVNIINEHGIFPVANFQKAYTPEADNISGETMAKTILTKKHACFRCPIACGRIVRLKDGKEVGGPEYETVWSYGADCEVYDLNAIAEANYWCNQYGLDTISTGATIAAAMELYQKGYIKDEEIAKDGLSLKFGDPEAIVGWTIKIGKREGLGDKLAEGSYRLCEAYGVAELSMSVKKLELPAYDPRGVQGHGLVYATANRGGCHVRGYLISAEILGIPQKLDRFSLENKAEWAKLFQDLTAVIDSLGMCLFTSFALGLKDYVDLINAVCGTDYTEETLLTAGERINNLERLFNLKAGIDPSQDTLPKRLLEEPIPEGPSKGAVHKLSELLPKYYEVRGWDEKGYPKEETLKRLEI
ncbi:aldehyde ferredoxin oxidoreductase family protein [Thermodesulfobacterium sp. TA1]|uniref:aldehyde ferredoxin oxidoreductase family protein n=1 Tax=Thermodesulfobacterium sp. TA1 TaxID=2234087 RepID=UPI00123293FF|nr:aldehyde ferredoxin oxidoreductase family protein [Thermodesulfobacterium sp. TA1]QER41923.1 aldehyde ferredoxin oxidoreductase family protein [Thermodesulfobacterium sp. TA1]